MRPRCALLLAAAGCAGAPNLAVSAATHDFSSVVLGLQSPQVAISVSNDGGAATGPVMITLAGSNPEDFVVDPGTCGAAKLAVAASCEVRVRFAPVAAGSRSATLTFSSSPGGHATVALSGTGALQQLSIAFKTSASAAGVVSASGGGSEVLSCSTGTCGVGLRDQAAVTLSATPSPGSIFTGWSGACSGAASTCSLTMDGPKSVVATFRLAANLVFVSPAALAIPFGANGAAAQTAADQLCNARATAAGLPGHFVAWLSTSGTNAISKLGAANGWVRWDGRPFANTQADLAAGRIFYPPAQMENGDDAGSLMPATGTLPDGTLASGQTCSDWMSTSGSTTGTGVPSGGNQAWTLAPYSLPCSTSRFAVYCFETSMNTTVAPSARGRYAFVSKQPFTPGVGRSRADADAICGAEAVAAGLPGDYLALLALTSEAPIARFSTAGAPWVRPDGVAIVASASDITKEAALAPLDQAADGTYVATGDSWTGSTATDLAGDAATTCHDWSSTAGSGNGGQIEYSVHWFDEYRLSLTCLGAQPVYCLEK